VIELLALAALAGDPSVRPWPIGPGPAYRPAPAARPTPGLACAKGGSAFAVHVELFANRRAIVVPAGIGVARGCSYPARTRTPTGIVEVARDSNVSLGDLFRIWHQPLGPRRLLSFRSPSPVRAYVNGHRAGGSVGSIRLEPGAEVVLELGGYVPPHASFLFPKGLS
jgi:hypothetical protein